MDNKQLQDVLMNFFKENNVNIFAMNGETFIDKKNALDVIVKSIDETLQEGDINGVVLNIENITRFIEANKIGYALFINPTKIEIECMQNLSFATTTITCENFGFDVKSVKESIRRNNKERYDKFSSLIDFLDISSGVKPKEIIVNFAVNDVWAE